MEQEKGNFRSRVFGGFHRQDVIDYIEELAAERNTLAKENSELQERVYDLEERAAEPEAQEESAEDCRAQISDMLTEARELLASVKAEYDALFSDVNINVSHAQGELKNMTARLSGIISTLKTAGERLEAVSGMLEEKEE